MWPVRCRAGRDTGPRRALKNWPVRSRLLLLVVTPTLTTLIFGIVLITSSLRSASSHSSNGAVHAGAIVSALVDGAVVIIVVLVAVLVMIVVARSMVEPLRRLQDGALEVTKVLPEAVRRISETDGEGVPLDVKPIGVDSLDEIGVVARAFDQVSGEALRLAANEAALRGNVSAIFVNLSRRSQSLVERQISLIDDLEQGEQDPERLANLFKMDHLATRMRRNSENLLVLAGHDLFSHGNQPIALVDVIRAAVSEIEEYERVSLNVQRGIMVSGPAVNDVVHTLAELAENATSLSSTNTEVKVSGHLLTSGGVLIDITDQGVGMNADEMAHANWRLENPPLVDVGASRRMGLFVVGRLAERHGIRIRLRPAASGGVTALVWLPDELITHEDPVAQLRLGGLTTPRSSPDLPEGMASWPGHASQLDADRGHAEEQVTAARRPKFAPLRAEGQDAPVNPRHLPGTGLPAATDGDAGAAEPEAAGIGGEAAIGPTGLARGPGGTGPPHGSGLSVPGGNDDASPASASLTGSVPFSSRTRSASGSVIVPPAQDAGEEQRLPVFEAVESDWFRRGHRRFGSSSTTAEADGSWASPADDGWRAAETAASPSSGGVTESGLPKRVPQANLVPGAATGSQPAAPPRSALTTRERFASFQRGVEEGRAAAGSAEDPGGADETS